jgi:fibronectin-binding autotransporter adhesin
MKFKTALAFALLALCSHLHGATRTWNALGVNGYWNVATNWQGNVAPASGDDLVFPSTATTLKITNNYTSATFNSIFLTGSNYNITGNTIFLENGLTNVGVSNSFLIAAVLKNDQTWQSGGGSLTTGIINNGGHKLTVWAGTINISGYINGSGALEKYGTGVLWMSNTNLYTGATTIYDGTIRVSTSSAFGAASNLVTVGTPQQYSWGSGGGALELTNSISIPQSLLVYSMASNHQAGQLRSSGGTNILLGSLTFTNPSSLPAFTPSDVTVYVGQDELICSNTISGNCGVVKRGIGQLRFTTNNTYSDPVYGNDVTYVETGTLYLDAPSGVQCIPGDLGVGGYSVFNYFPQIKLGKSLSLNSGRGLYAWWGTIDLNGQQAYVQKLGSGDGRGSTLYLNGGTLHLGATSGTATYAGTIVGPGSIEKSGNYTQIFTGTNSSAQPTTISGGTLVINGLHSNSPVNLLGGTVFGNGYCGPLNALAGQIGNLFSWGTLHVMGDLNLGPAVTVATAITNINGFGQLDVTGNIALNSASLLFTNSITATGGTALSLLKNHGGNPVAGSFNNVTEGSIFVSGAHAAFQFSYAGGTGLDVALTRVQPPATIAAILPTTNSMILTASGIANASYQIQSSTNLIDWTYLNFGNYITCNASGLVSYTNTIATRPRTFYRFLTP